MHLIFWDNEEINEHEILSENITMVIIHTNNNNNNSKHKIV